MARIQILELPEGAGDERPPFALVIDQCEGVTLELVGAIESSWKQVGEQIGARGVLIFMEKVDIPANEIPVGPDGYPVRLHVEGDFTKFREQVMTEIAQAQAEMRASLR